MVDEKLICIVYLSHARKRLTEHDLNAILEVSRRNNAADNITGQLVHAEGNFIQAIEGPEPKVLALLERLRRDRRHSTPVILIQWEIEKRAFHNWNMSFRRLTRADPRKVADLMPAPAPHEIPDSVNAPNDSIARRLLDQFRQGNRDWG